MHIRTLIAAALGLAACASAASAQVFSIDFFSIDGGGTTAASGGTFSLAGAIGQADDSDCPGGPMGGTFSIVGGFWSVAFPSGIWCPPDFNHDCVLNPDDLGDFITCFFLESSTPGACPQADFNTDADVNPDDLGDFITAYFQGC